MVSDNDLKSKNSDSLHRSKDMFAYIFRINFDREFPAGLNIQEMKRERPFISLWSMWFQIMTLWNRILRISKQDRSKRALKMIELTSMHIFIYVYMEDLLNAREVIMFQKSYKKCGFR